MSRSQFQDRFLGQISSWVQISVFSSILSFGFGSPAWVQISFFGF